LRIQLPTSELQRLMPSSPGAAAHCRRVAALCRELATRLPLSWRSLTTLEQAAMLHHTSAILLGSSESDRLLAEIAAVPLNDKPSRDGLELPEDLAALLSAFHGFGSRVPGRESGLLVKILIIADAIDQQFESLAWDPRPIAQLWDELADLSGAVGETVWKAAVAALRHPFRVWPGREWDLPVHAPVVKEVAVGLREHPDCDVNFLAKLAGRDPVLAGNVLTAANSAWFGRRAPVRSVSQAIAYIGADTCRRILLALALKPLFGSARLAALWRHSLDMAGLCESLAAATGFLPPDEALTLGLVHDIGRVALLRQTPSANSAFARLMEQGCPPVYAEQILFGEGHDEIGARILESWGFAEDIVEAVRAHHQPADSDSPAAAGLYLAEFWSETDEDLPSARHFERAQRRLGCSIEMLGNAARSEHPLSELLQVA
jgi:putative nucleotidyltransferase with HDIG domain